MVRSASLVSLSDLCAAAQSLIRYTVKERPSQISGLKTEGHRQYLIRVLLPVRSTVLLLQGVEILAITRMHGVSRTLE